MMSIEDRLARDAAQARVDDPPAPSLDLLLDRAIATAPRRRLQVWLAVAAALVVAAGVAAIVTVRLNRDSTEPAAGITLPTPHSIVRDGKRFPVGVSSPIGLVRDPSDPKVLDVYALAVYQSPKCTRLSPSARILDQSGSTVRVVTFDYARVPIEQQFGCAYSEGLNHRLIRLRLSEPLGSRTVVDVRTGKPLAVLSRSKAPTPGYLPAGYHATDVQNFNPPHNFSAVRSYRHGNNAVFIAFAEAPDFAPVGNVTRHVKVHGNPALVFETGPMRCLLWTDPTGLASRVCSYTPKSQQLPVAELLRVAESLPH